MTELTALSALIELGLPAVLMVGIVILWRQNQELLKLLLESKTKADTERLALAQDLKELKFWSRYSGDNPEGHDPEKPYADDIRAALPRSET